MKAIRPLGIFAAFCAFITLLVGVSLAGLIAVSYTHLTLPTIYSV